MLIRNCERGEPWLPPFFAAPRKLELDAKRKGEISGIGASGLAADRPAAEDVGGVRVAGVDVVKRVEGVETEDGRDAFVDGERLGERDVGIEETRASVVVVARVSDDIESREREDASRGWLRCPERPGMGGGI